MSGLTVSRRQSWDLNPGANSKQQVLLSKLLVLGYSEGLLQASVLGRNPGFLSHQAGVGPRACTANKSRGEAAPGHT